MRKHWTGLVMIVVLTAAGWVVLPAPDSQGQGARPMDHRIFEIRTYHVHPGKMEALQARFRNHTNKLFVKHGMEIIGFWTPIDAQEAEKRLVYILAYPSKEAADKSWAAFRSDPAWQQVKDVSEKDGPLVARIESFFVKATDYSPIK